MSQTPEHSSILTHMRKIYERNPQQPNFSRLSKLKLTTKLSNLSFKLRIQS